MSESMKDFATRSVLIVAICFAGYALGHATGVMIVGLLGWYALHVATTLNNPDSDGAGR